MAGMNPRTRELIAYGEGCGFVLDGRDGNDHYRMTHPNGAVVRVSGSPGDYRGDDNTRAEMRRKSGVTPSRPRSGKYRRGVRLERFTGATERVESRSWKLTGLQDRHRKLCAAIDAAQSADEASAPASALLAVEAEIVALGATPPPRAFRMGRNQEREER